MSETHTEMRNGWVITVWLSSFGATTWLYRASKGMIPAAGAVEASHRTDAVNKVVELLKIGG